MRRLVHLATALLLILPALSSASFFRAGEGRYALVKGNVSYRVDARSAEEYERVAQETTGWSLQRDQPFPGTLASQVVWVRFDVPRPRTGTAAFMVADAWERVDYFIFRDGQLVDRQKAGTLVPYSERKTHVAMVPEIIQGGFVAVDVRDGARTSVLARMENTNRYYHFRGIGFLMMEADPVRDGERRDGVLQGLFCGIMLFLIVYNLGLGLVTREASFFYYVLMESGLTFAWALINGLTSFYLWPEHPWWDFGALWVAANLGGVGTMQFLRYYLGARAIGPKTDATLRYLSYWTLVATPVAWMLPIPYGLLTPTMIYSGPIGAVLVVLVIVKAFRARHPLAANLLIAMSCFAVGTILYAAAEMRVVPRVDLFIHAGQLGSVLCGVVLSMGLGFRMRNLREQLASRELAHEREVRALIEEQNRTLEAKVIERTAQLQVEQEKSESLLANILPRAVIDELRAKGETEPRRHEEASILFTDFSGFTQAVSTMPPRRLVQELNDIFRGFDDIVSRHGLEKIKTIGDAYMAAGGLPLDAADHAVRCVQAALELTRFIEERNRSAAMKWGLRVGVHSGAVVAGVVGKNKYAYDVWGDTVNLASRLESSGEVGRVNVSAYTFDLVRDRFECEYRGKIAAKGKGDIDMYFVVRERVAETAPATAD